MPQTLDWKVAIILGQREYNKKGVKNVEKCLVLNTEENTPFSAVPTLLLTTKQAFVASPEYYYVSI